MKTCNKENGDNALCAGTIDFIKDFAETDAVLKQIMNFNMYEDVISENHYEMMFKEFLKRCGYTITKTESEQKKKKEKKDDTNNEANYMEIPTLTLEELKVVRENIKKGVATESNKLSSSKHYFRLIIKCDDNKTEADLFYNYYCNRFGKQLLTNAAKEINPFEQF